MNWRTAIPKELSHPKAVTAQGVLPTLQSGPTLLLL